MDFKLDENGLGWAKVKKIPSTTELAWLNKLAKVGWDYRLIHVSYDHVVFKRTVDSKEEVLPFFEWFKI
jgi:hypothetical protein